MTTTATTAAATVAVSQAHFRGANDDGDFNEDLSEQQDVCGEEGYSCMVDYDCCGSYKCDGSTDRCIRETNESFCRPQGDSCTTDSQCCGAIACISSRCAFGTSATCKKPGGYCEQDYACCDDLECGVSHHCVLVNDNGCGTQGEYCIDDHLGNVNGALTEPFHEAACCDSWKCNGSQCVTAGRSQCKLRNDFCDGFNDQCCGDLICDGRTLKCTDPTSSGTCLEEKTGDFCASAQECDCDGMRTSPVPSYWACWLVGNGR